MTIMFRRIARQPTLVLIIWGALAVEFAAAVYEGLWPIAYLAVATFLLSLLPVFFAQRFDIRVPPVFFAWIVAFIFATIFLGEAFDYYERFWWWDIAMHSTSALGFGMLGVLFMLMLFDGDRYAAPPWAIAFFGFCFAIAVGALWEIFEFAMDQNFGLNMQKNGLHDTMWDMIVNTIGAAVGALVGFLYLKGRRIVGLSRPISEFVRENRHFFRKHRP
jgi:uncharacterized membrane protein YjdF